MTNKILVKVALLKTIVTFIFLIIIYISLKKH
jgi:hypothetical protein